MNSESTSASIKAKNGKVSKRKPLSSFFNKTQHEALKKYFNEINAYPKHAEKKDLSEKHGIDPLLLNKWFQSERTKKKKAQTQQQKKQAENAVANAP